ncbi:MAG: DUF92 domain-containing protein [Gemmatimonadaceae bacterium]
MSFILTRIVAGAVLATAVAVLARDRGALTFSGAVAAAILGTICVAAGWTWGVMLVAFFLSGTGLSRLWEDRKSANTRGIAEKGGERDAFQVHANGAVFTALAAASILFPSIAWTIPAAAALAASAADTWATEIGTLSSRPPRSITTWQRVAPGTSGAVSIRGTAAAIAGAGFMAGIALLLDWPTAAAMAAITGGVTGAFADSLLGATLQATRWCGQCVTQTERRVHDCGTATTHIGGLRWLNNDGVNAISSAAGAAVGTMFLL